MVEFKDILIGGLYCFVGVMWECLVPKRWNICFGGMVESAVIGMFLFPISVVVNIVMWIMEWCGREKKND